MFYICLVHVPLLVTVETIKTKALKVSLNHIASREYSSLFEVSGAEVAVAIWGFVVKISKAVENVLNGRQFSFPLRTFSIGQTPVLLSASSYAKRPSFRHEQPLLKKSSWMYIF